MKLSVRNLLRGTVKKIVNGPVNVEVTIEISGGAEIVSTITETSAERLGLRQGSPVYAVIKASSVMLAVD
jgi:molybdopterin-binding protein